MHVKESATVQFVGAGLHVVAEHTTTAAPFVRTQAGAADLELFDGFHRRARFAGITTDLRYGGRAVDHYFFFFFETAADVRGVIAAFNAGNEGKHKIGEITATLNIKGQFIDRFVAKVGRDGGSLRLQERNVFGNDNRFAGDANVQADVDLGDLTDPKVNAGAFKFAEAVFTGQQLVVANWEIK